MKDQMKTIENHLRNLAFRGPYHKGNLEPEEFDLYLRVEQVKASRRIADALETMVDRGLGVES